MIRLLLLFLLSFSSFAACFGSDGSSEVNADTKKAHPPKPEEGGLQLEVSAELDDIITSDGVNSKWGGATLEVEIALQNVSQNPITVATTAYAEKATIADWPAWGPGLERIMFSIDSPRFQGKPTVYAPSRFAPVVLAPGERVLLLHHFAMMTDRKHADSVKEVSVHYGVASTFIGPKEWWKGYLETYANIHRSFDPDKYIEQSNANQERYNAEKEAEKRPGYGRRNAARVAELIAGSDQASIRGELAKEADGVVVRDSGWIRQVSEAIADTPLPRSAHCFCIGSRTAYFYRDGQFAVSVAGIGGNQLRVQWTGGGGDYLIDEAHYLTVKKALDFPTEANHTPEPTPGAAH
jgi:hypothetical protein